MPVDLRHSFKKIVEHSHVDREKLENPKSLIYSRKNNKLAITVS